MARKTLMLGLGGTGSKVIALMRKMIREHGGSEDDIRFVGFDTDTNSEGKEGVPMVSTSTNRTIDDYVKAMPSCKEWFGGYYAMQDHTLLSGAGQMRMFSRLAFAETVTSGRLHELERAISELTSAGDGDRSDLDFRVVIVSSFAGGTGSGMFLQCAFWIRRHLMVRYRIKPSLVKGIFAMPDIFTHNIGDAEQHANMYSNAYACIKELSAVNIRCLADPNVIAEVGDDVIKNIRMKIDDLFDSQNPKTIVKPFDFIFFVDRVNKSGRSLGIIDNYIELMATIAYMQLYDKIQKNAQSQEDNTIGSIMLDPAGSRRMYGTAGAAKLIYPYEIICEYCGKHVTIDALSEGWRKIDDQFERDNAVLIQKKRRDPSVQLLDRGEYYVTNLEEQMLPIESPLHFVVEDVTEKMQDEDGREEAVDRFTFFTTEVETFIEEKLASSDRVNELLALSNPGARNHYKDNASITIQTREDSIQRLRSAYERHITMLASSVASQIFPETLADCNTTSAYSLNTLLTKIGNDGREYIHPISVRYQLYRFLHYLKANVSSYQEQMESLLQSINGYATGFEVPANGNDVNQGTAVDAVNNIMRNRGLFGSRLNNFIDEYIDRAGEQIKRIKNYAKAKMYVAVYGALVIRISALIRQYEVFFKELTKIIDALQSETNELVEQLRAANPMKTLVGVSDRDLRNTLARVRETFAENQLDQESNGRTNSNIFRALFDESRRQIKHDESVKRGYDEEFHPLNMRKIFNENILEKNEAHMRNVCVNVLDIDIYQAMKDSLNVPDEELLDAIKETYIFPTYEKAIPYLQHDGNFNRSQNYFWGYNPEVADYFAHNPNGLVALFTTSENGIAPTNVCDSSYSKREIVCYRAEYAIPIDNIPQFSETLDGIYFKHYKHRISLLTPANLCCSPHLDKNWHRASYVPHLTPGLIEDAKNKAARAFWLARFYGIFRLRPGKPGHFYTSCRLGDRNEDLLFCDSPVNIDNAYYQYQALLDNESITEAILAEAEPMFRAEKFARRDDIDFNVNSETCKRFIKAVINLNDYAQSRGLGYETNAVDVLVSFASVRTTNYTDSIALEKAIITLINEFGEGIFLDSDYADLTALIVSAANNSPTDDQVQMTNYLREMDFWFKF